MKYQRVLRMWTDGPAVVSHAWGWMTADGLQEARHPGVMAPTKAAYPTPLAALGAGWRLMAPPSAIPPRTVGARPEDYEWWFESFEEAEPPTP